MSMEEVSMYEDEVLALRRIIERTKQYVRIQPLDLLKPHEIQRDLLVLLEDDQKNFEYDGRKYIAKKDKSGSWHVVEDKS